MSGISADGTDGTDGVPADADADDDAVLTLQALNIVTCAVDARVAEANARLRAQNRALRARLTDWDAGAVEPKVGKYYQFSDPGLYHFHVSRRHDMLRETCILSGEILGANDEWHRLVSDRFPLSGPVYRYLGHRSETEFEYPCAARKRTVKARSHIFELPVAAATVDHECRAAPGEPLGDGGAVGRGPDQPTCGRTGTDQYEGPLADAVARQSELDGGARLEVHAPRLERVEERIRPREAVAREPLHGAPPGVAAAACNPLAELLRGAVQPVVLVGR